MTTGSLPTLLDTAQSRRLSAGGDPNAAARQGRPTPPDGGDWLGEARRYLRSVRRHKWLVLSLTSFATAAGVELSMYALPPNYAARATVWIQVPARQARDEGPIWSGQLPISSGWIDLIRTNIVLEDVARRERLYLTTVVGDPAALTTLAIKQRVHPGTYRLAVDTTGTAFVLSDDAGAVLDRGAIGDSIGAPLGFAWVAPAGMLRPGDVVEFTVTTPAEAATRLRRELKVSSDADGNFLRLELAGPDAAAVTGTVNAVATRFVAAAADLKRDNLTQLTGVLAAQLEQEEAKLRSAESALQRFRVTAVTEYGDGIAPVTTNMRSPQDPVFAGLLDMKVRRGELLRDRAAIKRILAQPPESRLLVDALATITSVERSSELSQALRDLTAKQAALRALRVRYTAEAPAVRRVATDVATLERQTIPLLATALARELALRAAELEQRVDSVARDLRRIPPLAVEENRLQRDVTQSAGAVANLQQRYEEARLAETSSIPDVRLVDPAIEPQEPTENWAPVLVLFTLISGLGAGVGSAVVLDYRDRRVHDPEDFTRTVGLKILGVVPHLERRGRIRAPEDALHVLEAMRGTCLNLLHAHGIGPVIVTVTSPGRADGKSFVASNLAVAFADAGYRTLLVDGDVRCGMLHRTLKLARKPGLTDLLQGRASKEQVVQPSAYGTLSFLGSGSRTHDGPTLVSSAALPRALARLRSSYDAIIVDSSPLAAGTDAFALGTATGTLLLVLRTGVSDGGLAQAKLQVMNHLPIRVLGAVLNDVRRDRLYRNYSYYLEGYEAHDEPDGARGQVLRAPV